MHKINRRRARRRRVSAALRVAAVGAVGALALSGCATLIERTAEKTAEAVNAYCDTFSAADRQAFGDRVRVLAAPDSISVTCN